MLGGLGLTVTKFFEAIPDQDVRKFIDPKIISVLDAIFDGRIGGEDLRRVVGVLVDFQTVLADENSRRLVLSLIPEQKRAELDERLGEHTCSLDAWGQAEVQKLCGFFGLEEEYVEPLPKAASNTIMPKYGLFDHQRKAVERIKPYLFEDERRAILHLPTGVGKTRTAMHIVAETLRSHEPCVVVWLASGKELLEQAALAFKEAWSHLGSRPVQVGTVWGDQSPNLEDFLDGILIVGLAKGWSMLSRDGESWTSLVAPRVRLVVFDEAHQSIARTYRRITEDLMVDYRCALLGLTATPGRTWADLDEDGLLADHFARQKVTLEVPGDNPIKYLIEEGFLAKPNFRTLFAKPGLDLSDKELIDISNSLDIPQNVLYGLSLSEQYTTAILEAIENLISENHQRIIVFAISVEHAQMLAAILAARNIKSFAITGETSKRYRNRAIETFKTDRDEPMVLSNFGVLTTGFDSPNVGAVVIARPTQSLVLYSQMVGRAIRGPKVGGTEECDILTVIDPSLTGFGDVTEAFHNWEDVWTTKSLNS